MGPGIRRVASNRIAAACGIRGDAGSIPRTSLAKRPPQNFLEIPMLDRFRAMLHELRLELVEQNARRRERRALRALGGAISSAPSGHGTEVSTLITDLVQEQKRLEVLRARLTESQDKDARDYTASAGWIRPLVVLRGLCTR